MFVTTDDGVRIHVEAAPDNGKPAIIFSNSLGTNLHMWDAQFAAFGEAFRVIRYDSRGHGRSDAPKGPYSIDRLGRDVLAVMDGFAIKRGFFCGLSKGGMVGQWLGARAPDRLERLVLCNTAAHMPAPDLWNQRIETASRSGMGPLAAGVVERWLTPEFRKRNPAETERITAMVLATPPLGYAASCAAIRDMDMRASNKAIKAPTLVVIGANDPATPPENGQAIQRSIPGSELATIEAAHLSNIERADDFNRTVLGFLTR